MIIVLEGPDGAGKTTLARALVEHVTKHKGPGSIAYFRDPGSSKLGEGLRVMLRDPDFPMHPRQQTLLFTASRHALLQDINAWFTQHPSGIAVVDRFLLSTLVYQTMQGVSMNDIIILYELFCSTEIKHTLNMFLCDPGDEELSRRLRLRNASADRYEGALQSSEVVKRYRLYNTVFADLIRSVGTINTSNSISECIEFILKTVERRFE